MASKNGAILAVKIISDASEASRGFDQAESRADRFARGLDRASVAAGGVLVGIAAAGREVFDAASSFEQSTGAINSVFGDWALDIEQSAQQAVDSVGLSETAYQELAATVGAQLKNMGMDNGDAVASTQELIQQGADLAATFGGSTADAVSALGSALRGETDPLERYGIGIKEADIQARLAAMGLDDLEGEAAKQARTQALLAMITEQSGGALGAFAREADTAAGQQQRATAQFENAQKELGTALLPIVAAAAEKFAALARWVGENASTVQILVGVLAGLAATVLLVNGVMKAWSAIQAVVTAAQWLWNVAVAANPLVLLGLLLAAVIAAVVVMYQKFDWFRNFITGAFRVVTAPLRFIWDILSWIWEKVGGLGGIFRTFGSMAAAALDFVMTPLRWIWDALEWIVDKLSWVGDAASWVGDLFSAPAPPEDGGDEPRGSSPGGSGGALFGAGGGMGGELGGGVGSAGAGGPAAGDTYVFHISGLLDSDQAADKIEDLLNRRQRRTGRTAAVVVK